MVYSMAIVENMIYAYIFIVVVNVLVSFRLLDQAAHVVSGLVTGSADFVALFLKYQQGIDRTLRLNGGGIPIITPICRLLAYSLQVYMNRISEITLLCATPSVLFTIKGYVWVYLVPQWIDDIFDKLAMRWRNMLLFLTYGEDFSHPPPLEVDQSAIPPQRSLEEDISRFHPKFGFQPSTSNSTPSPVSSPTRKGKRREQKLMKQRQEKLQQQILEEKSQKKELACEFSEKEIGGGSVWDPTWGVISRDVQEAWQAEELARREALQSRSQKPSKPLPPVRS